MSNSERENVKQGCLISDGSRVMDDTSMSHTKNAVRTAKSESRMTHTRKGACTDARR